MPQIPRAGLLLILLGLRALAQTSPPTTVTARDSRDHNGDLPPASATLVNRYLPPWITFTGELRERAEGYSNGSFNPVNSDAYVVSRFRLGMMLKPVSWIKVYGELQDARVWLKRPALPPNQNTWNLRQAYAELGNSEGAGFALRVGRQEFDFGNGRLIGKSWWTNVSRSFDAVRGSYQFGNFRVDAFIGSVVIVRDGAINHHNPGNNLGGLYGSLKNVVLKNSIFEPYTFLHVQHSVVAKSGKFGHLQQYTTGLRWVGKLPANFDYRTEMAIQRGTLGGDRIRSWMGHWTGGYSLPNAWLKTRFFVEYDHASGDSGRVGVIGTFDPIYPSTHDKLGVADVFGWRNIRDLRFGQEYHVARKWEVASSFHDFWLASEKDALYPTRGAVIVKPQNGRYGGHIGEEFDVQTVYKPSAQTQIGAGYGHVFTGKFLNHITKGKDYNYPYIFAEYVF